MAEDNCGDDVRETPFVSCVMTVFNGQAHIDEAIESVLAQSYSNWELLIVDDGSTDASRAIAEKYSAAHPTRIKVLWHPGGCNAGKSVSRNLGVEASTGSIIALLDADDIWAPQKLAEQVSILQRHPEVEFTYGPVIYHYAWTGRLQDRDKDSPSRLGVPPNTVITPPRLLTKMLRAEVRRSECIFPYPSSAAFRRTLFDRVGGFEADFTRLYDDAIFFAKALAVAKAFPATAVLAKYRLHPGEMLSYSYEEAIASRSGSRSEVERAEQQFLLRIRQFLKARRLRNMRLEITLVRATLPYSNPRADRIIRLLLETKSRVMAKLRKVRRSFLRPQGGPARITSEPVLWGDLGARPLFPPSMINGRGGSITDRHFDSCVRRLHDDITGDAAEIGDDVYLRRYRSARLRSSTILKPQEFYEAKPRDPAGQYDCLIAQDIVRFSRDPTECLRALAHRLKAHGVLHTSLTAIAPVIPGGDDRWRFTDAETRLLFDASGCLHVTHLEIIGGLKAATAVLHGLGVNDLGTGGDSQANDIPVSIFVRAVKAGDPESFSAGGEGNDA